jgi:hypothetical protein
MLALHVLSAALSPLASHEYFLREIALSKPPETLAALADTLVAAGGQLASPTPVVLARHPLLIPLTQDADGCITGLLRWPNGQSVLPVVRTSTDNNQLTFLAESADK